MRTIEIDDELYTYLLQKTEYIGETASSILKRQLGLPIRAGGRAGARTPGNGIDAPNQKAGSVPADPLLEYLQSERFRFLGNATDKYLGILGFAHHRDQANFEKLLVVAGRKRRYFGRSYSDIEGSGKSTYPQQIPGSAYWALTNADTDRKGEILTQALRRLGYHEGSIAAACRALD